ncbi:steroid 3-ketoacyl-CoA thiolase [Micromonospora sp. CPCC 206061]|uniref:steroid 3-ketoacyl-CoA thiolase n=1 Tax=Micromonospora sp. CPCC 206061 TaxID=3122410 RepID=UPI002FEF8D39
MATPVIVEAVRTPIGRRGGSLSGLKAVELLRAVQRAVIERAGVAPGEVDQIIGGCVTQAGEQSLNVTRNAWLSTGLDYRVPATTVDASCGSGQQANHLVAALITAGVIEVGIACGVESMSRVPIGVNLYNGPGHYKTADYPWQDPPKSQFGGAERIARREGVSRAQLDEYGLLSQDRAAAAWAQGRFDREVVPLKGPVPGPEAEPSEPGEPRQVEVTRDEGVRPSTATGLTALAPVLPDGLHTAATISQISDGAAAVLWMSEDRARAEGLRPRARLVHQVVTGADPYYLLDGPIEATAKLLDRSGMALGDIDRYEVNEAFAAVVLAWSRRYRADAERLNVSGGAIALGHPLGATGTRLIATALHELERCGGEYALVTMCCGGSLGTASLLQRL